MKQVIAKGVDISTWNGDVDFRKLRAEGVDFVIIRCGYGSNIEQQDDERFKENVRKATEIGMPYGVYLYSYADTLEKAKSEAEHTLRLIKGTTPLYGIWYDVEDVALPKDKKFLTDICVTYLEMIENAGYYAGIYSSLSWFNTRFENERIKPYDKWVAQWNKELTYKGTCGLWQFTNSYKIDDNNFDCNYSFRDFPSIIKGMSKPSETPKKSVAEMVKLTLLDEFGTGSERKARIKAEGYDYNAIQGLVNVKCREYMEIAKSVKKGNWGDGETRKKALRKAGYEEWEITYIQNLVNMMYGNA